MANAAGKQIDKTFLSIDNAENRGFIHRDYIAHCLRWSHVVKCLYKNNDYRQARILDVGCGKETPLAKMLYSSRLTPAKYIGVDYGPIEDFNFGKYQDRFEFWEREDFVNVDLTGPYSHVTCFEVLEHVEPAHVLSILSKIRELMTDQSYLFVSTPNWNGRDCAANHVNEMSASILASVFIQEGFTVKANYGTFASQRDIEPVLTAAELNVYDKLKQYYDSNLVSCLFAPLHAMESRNILWVLKKAKLVKVDFYNPSGVEWSSSSKWKELRRV